MADGADFQVFQLRQVAQHLDVLPAADGDDADLQVRHVRQEGPVVQVKVVTHVQPLDLGAVFQVLCQLVRHALCVIGVHHQFDVGDVAVVEVHFLIPGGQLPPVEAELIQHFRIRRRLLKAAQIGPAEVARGRLRPLQCGVFLIQLRLRSRPGAVRPQVDGLQVRHLFEQLGRRFHILVAQLCKVQFGLVDLVDRSVREGQFRHRGRRRRRCGRGGRRRFGAFRSCRFRNRILHQDCFLHSPAFLFAQTP